METEVEIDVGQENFSTSKVNLLDWMDRMDNKVLIRRERTNYLKVEVEASPAIMASLTSMEQDVPSLQVGVGWKRKLWQLASEVKVKVKVMAYVEYHHMIQKSSRSSQAVSEALFDNCEDYQNIQNSSCKVKIRHSKSVKISTSALFAQQK